MVRIFYAGRWLEWDVVLEREMGGQAQGLAAQLSDVQFAATLESAVDVGRLEGALAEVDGIRMRVTGAEVDGLSLTCSLEPVDVREGGLLAGIGVTQDRWPVDQQINALTTWPYFERVRVGPPDASVGLAYPVVLGQPGAWLDEAGAQVTGQGTPVIVLDTEYVEVTRQRVLATADGTSAYVTVLGRLSHLPISSWPMTVTTVIGGSVVVGLLDPREDPIFSGSLLNATLDIETGIFSVSWDGVPDAEADVTVFWSAACWRGNVGHLLAAGSVMVGGVTCELHDAIDEQGLTVPVVWLGGAGSTDVPVWDGSALECCWTDAEVISGRLGDVIRMVADASSLAWDRAAVEACAALNHLRMDAVITAAVGALDWLAAEVLTWAPVLILEGQAGLRPVPVLRGDGLEVGGYAVSGDRVVNGADLVARVSVRWAGGEVSRDTGLAGDGVLELTIPTADRATAEWVADWWLTWRGHAIVERQWVTPIQLQVGQWARFGGALGFVAGSRTSPSNAVTWSVWTSSTW